MKPLAGRDRQELLGALNAAGCPLSTGDIAECMNKNHQITLQLLYRMRDAGEVAAERDKPAGSRWRLLWWPTGKPLQEHKGRDTRSVSGPVVQRHDHRALAHALGMDKGEPASLGRLPARVHRLIEDTGT